MLVLVAYQAFLISVPYFLCSDKYPLFIPVYYQIAILYNHSDREYNIRVDYDIKDKRVLYSRPERYQIRTHSVPEYRDC